MKQHLGHYDIVAELGRGGMGVVYKGYEAALNRYVAIKVLADSLAHDAAIKERFLREARSMAALNDPHIIQIYFIGEDEGQTFFVMEFVDGESLGSVLKREGLLRPDQAARVVYQTAQGLATAHDHGVIHRDIKPGNIMIGARGNVKIADFGIALSAQDFSKKLTSTGEFVGTPGYLSPEVCLGKPVDQRSDIFSLGIVLFEMLAGRMPFTDESPLGLMLEVVKAEIPDVCTLNSEVDPELSRILTRMIAKDPGDRYQSCQELVDDLARHPRLASAGTLQLRTQPSAAAATVIGMKTPAAATPGIAPTPQPLPRATPLPAPATPARAAPLAEPVVAHEPVLQRQAATRKSSAAVPLAIAAILLLGVAGGAFAYRDQIPLLRQWLPASLFATASPPPALPTPSAVAPPVVAASTVAAIPPSPPAPAVVSIPADATGAAASAAPSSAAVASAPNAASATPPLPPPAPAATVAPAPPPSAAASVAELIAANAPPASPPAPAAASGAPPPNAAVDTGASDAAVAGPAARASQVEPLKELAAAKAAQASATAAPQVAKMAPPAPVAPHVPTVAVLFGGDIDVTAPAARVIEQALSRHGYRLLDAELMPAAERFLGGPRANIAGLLDLLAKGGRVDAVVIVHARQTGMQNLPAYGMNVEATTAQLNVNVYAVQGARKLGQGWTENVMYSGLSAKEKGEEAVEEIAPQVDAVLADYRPGRNRG